MKIKRTISTKVVILLCVFVFMLSYNINARGLSEADIYKLLNEATSAAGWFNGSSKQFVKCDDGEIITDESGKKKFARVTDEFDTFDKLKEIMYSYFTKELADGYLYNEYEVFKVNDDKLYYRYNFNSTAQTIQVIFDESNSEIEILKEDDDGIVFKFTDKRMRYGTANPYYIYTLKKENGRYVFSDYVLPMEIKFQGESPDTSDAPLIAVCVLAAAAAACAAIIKRKRYA